MVMTVAPEIEARIREKVESGEFESADALLNEALRLLDLHKEEQEQLQRLRELIAEGDEGEGELLTRESWEADLEEIRRNYRGKNTHDSGEIGVDAPR